MAVGKEQVLSALAKVPSPGGTALTEARVLSDVVVSDGKVFFSITVDTAAVKAWEPVRKRAEDAVRAIPGVQSPSSHGAPPIPPTRHNRESPASTR
jgi:ATP-binding protein involved in chromosome partitioning